VLAGLSERDVSATELAGEPIVRIMTRTPHLNAPIGGLKVETKNGWFAARPSGTEEVYKLYAESFQGPAHLEAIVADGRRMVAAALGDGVA
jgi:phosphoglucomutase